MLIAEVVLLGAAGNALDGEVRPAGSQRVYAGRTKTPLPSSGRAHERVSRTSFNTSKSIKAALALRERPPNSSLDLWL